MNAISWLLDQLVEHGPSLLAGVSLVLVAGCVAMSLCRSPIERRRLGLLTGLGTGLYLVAALLPLPRWSLPAAVPAPAIGQPAALAEPLPAAPRDPAERAAALLTALDRVLLPTEPAQPPPTELASGPRPDPLPALTWPQWLAAAYLLLAAAVLLRSAIGLWRLRAVLRASQPGPTELLDACGAPRGTRLCTVNTPIRPFCAGWLRPVVVLPAELLAPERHGQALAVLRHEAAHLRARDPLAQLLFAVLAVPLACHPLFWWLLRDVRFHSELLADDTAAALAGRADYARQLLQLAECDQPQLVAAGTVAVFHRPSDFFRRIQMLLQREGCLSPSTSRLRRASQTLAALGLCLGAAGLFGVPAIAQEPGPATTNLRQQNDKLRSELDGLRAELQALRAMLEQQGSQVSLDQLLIRDKARHDLDAIVGSISDRVTPPGKLRVYQVQQGDSLQTIAKQQLGSPVRAAEIKRLNPGIEANRLKVGQKLLLPLLVEFTADNVSITSLLDTPANNTSAQDPNRPSNGPATGTAPAGSLNATGDLLPGSTVASGPTTLPTSLTPGGRPQQPTGPSTGPSTVPVLQDVPLIHKFFVADENGLPSRVVDMSPVERTAPVATTEAIADLATRCLDLQGELEIAEATAAETQQLAAAGQVSTMEAKKAAVKLNTLKRKFAIVQRLIHGEIQATESELEWLGQKRKEADNTDRLRLDMQIQRAKIRLDTLHSVK